MDSCEQVVGISSCNLTASETCNVTCRQAVQAALPCAFAFAQSAASSRTQAGALTAQNLVSSLAWQPDFIRVAELV